MWRLTLPSSISRPRRCHPNDRQHGRPPRSPLGVSLEPSPASLSSLRGTPYCRFTDCSTVSPEFVDLTRIRMWREFVHQQQSPELEFDFNSATPNRQSRANLSGSQPRRAVTQNVNRATRRPVRGVAPAPFSQFTYPKPAESVLPGLLYAGTEIGELPPVEAGAE